MAQKKDESKTLAELRIERGPLAPRAAELPALVERAEAAEKAAREAQNAYLLDPERRHSSQPDHKAIALSGAVNERRDELQRLRDELVTKERRLREIDRMLGAEVDITREAAVVASELAAGEADERKDENLVAMVAEHDEEIAALAIAIAEAEERHADACVQARLAGGPLPSSDELGNLESKRQTLTRMRDRILQMSAAIQENRPKRREAIAAGRARLADAHVARAEVAWLDASAALAPVAAALVAAQRAAGRIGPRDGVRVDVPETAVAAALTALRSEVEPLRVAPAATAGATAKQDAA